MHMQKVKLSASTGGLLEHDYRFEDDGVEHPDVKHPERMSKNYLVAPAMPKREVTVFKGGDVSMTQAKAKLRNSLRDAKDKHLETAGRKPKSNAVGLISTVVTLPADWPSSVPSRVFFVAAYQAIEEYYEMSGVKSPCIPAAVHRDETTDHMHHVKIPLVDGRLDANRVMTRSFMNGLHPFVQERVREITGVQCSILLDEQDAERRALSHVPQDELDAAVRAINRKAEAEARKMRSEAMRAVSRARTLEERLDDREAALDAKKRALDARERELDEREAALTDIERQRLKTRSTKFDYLQDDQQLDRTRWRAAGPATSAGL